MLFLGMIHLAIIIYLFLVQRILADQELHVRKNHEVKRHTPYHSRSKVNIHRGEELSNDTPYGVELPNFAFDFSEYFVNAAIIGNDRREFYLNIMILGHHTIYEDFPFEAISTDEKTLSQWSQAIKLWKKEYENHRSLRRKYLCVFTSLTNPKQSYQSTLTWLTVNRKTNHTDTSIKTNLNRNIEHVRCKMKGSLITKPSTLLVDIVEIGNSRSSDKSKDNSPHVLFSFSLNTSNHADVIYTGYPYRKLTSLEIKDVKVPATTSNQVPKIHACVANIRPMQSPRPLVGVPSLFEFIEHLLLLGIDHTTLGVMISQNSLLMQKYEYLFQSYLISNKLTLLSTAMVSYQDLPGFSGIQLNDRFASIFTFNQCLLRAKSDISVQYLFFIKPNQFLSFSGSKIPLDNLPSNFLQLLRREEKKSLERRIDKQSFLYSSYKSSSVLLQNTTKSSKPKKHVISNKRYLLNDNEDELPVCSFSLESKHYGLNDNIDLSIPFGPSDFFFFQNYYAKGDVHLLNDPKHNLFVVKPVSTRAIDVTAQGQILGLCTTTPSLISSQDSLQSEQVKDFLITLTYDEFPTPQQNQETNQIHHIHESLFQQIHSRLSISPFSNITAMADIKQRMNEFQTSVVPKLRREGKLPEQEIIQDRRTIKPPFWQHCNTNHLSDIYSKLLPP